MPEDEFERYLTLLARTLRLSDAQRDAIAAELRDHMEARLGELTLQGVEREEAIETALAEFGDASGLAKDLTRTNPERIRTRRHFMQTTFGTIAACAAVTFAVMLLVPNNKSGQPNQPAAVAQDGDAFGEFDSRPGRGGFGGFDDPVGDEFGGGGEFGGGFGPGAAPQPRLELAIHVVDCTEILRADRNRGDLLDRTAALANAVEQTVATVNTKGNRAIRVQPFEEFLIITATEEAHNEARKLLDQISDHVERRTAIQNERERELEMQRRERLAERAELEQAKNAMMAEIQAISAKIGSTRQQLDALTAEQNALLLKHGEDHATVRTLAEQIAATKEKIIEQERRREEYKRRANELGRRVHEF